MRRHLSALAAVALFSVISLPAPARACLNDRETNSRETEFKLQYPSRSISDENPDHDGPNVLHYLLMGAGGLLGAGGVGIGMALGFVLLRKPA